MPYSLPFAAVSTGSPDTRNAEVVNTIIAAANETSLTGIETGTQLFSNYPVLSVVARCNWWRSPTAAAGYAVANLKCPVAEVVRLLYSRKFRILTNPATGHFQQTAAYSTTIRCPIWIPAEPFPPACELSPRSLAKARLSPSIVALHGRRKNTSHVQQQAKTQAP